jgi:hypothetical protein
MLGALKKKKPDLISKSRDKPTQGFATFYLTCLESRRYYLEIGGPKNVRASAAVK